MSVQSFQNELRGGRTYRIRLILAQTQLACALEETTNLLQLGDHRRGVKGLVEPNRTAHLEPPDDRVHVHTFEILAVYLPGCSSDQLTGDGVAALQLSFVLKFELACYGRERRVDID